LTASKPTILIVDDDPDLLQVLADGLELLGHFNVECAINGELGLERFYEVHPDCVIIDVIMPNIDGYQLVQALRGDPASASTPLILLTALAQEKDRLSGLAVGADQFLIKPIDPRELIAAVQRALVTTPQERFTRLQRLNQAG
jgi:DNA-binding response OmpR family regulator